MFLYRFTDIYDQYLIVIDSSNICSHKLSQFNLRVSMKDKLELIFPFYVFPFCGEKSNA